MDEPDFGNWLAGFIDGEGCFDIRVLSGGNPSCRFNLFVNEGDAPIIEEIHHWAGFGQVSRMKARGRSRPLVGWTVLRKLDCIELVFLLRKFPLRAKKARDFEIWAQAVEEWTKVRLGRGHSADPAQERMRVLRAALVEGRSRAAVAPA